MRRSRPPPPKERKTGNPQYPRGNPPPPRRTANASPQASETAVNQSGRKNHAEAPPMKERPEAGGRNTWSRTSNRGRPVEPPDRREEATGEGDRHLSHVSPVEPTTGRATPTPTREERHLTVQRTRHTKHARHTRHARNIRRARHARHTMHRSGSRRTTSSSRHRSRSTNSDCPSRRSRRAQKNPEPAAVHKNMTAPPAAVDGHTAPPDPAAEAVIPAIATGKRILTGSKTPGKTLQIRRKCGENHPSCKRRDSRRRFRNHRRLRGKRLDTLLGFTSGQPSWLHRSQAGRSQVIARMTSSGHASDSGERATASGHTDLPSGQGKNAYAGDATGRGQQTPHRSRHKRSRCDRYRSKDRERSQRDRELPRR